MAYASSQALKCSEACVLRTEIARCKVEQIELNVWARGIAEEKVAVALTWTASARRLGMVSAVGTVLLTAVYAATLGAGLLSLQSPQEPIGDPWFSILEIVIILTMPPMVAMNRPGFRGGCLV